MPTFDELYKKHKADTLAKLANPSWSTGGAQIPEQEIDRMAKERAQSELDYATASESRKAKNAALRESMYNETAKINPDTSADDRLEKLRLENFSKPRISADQIQYGPDESLKSQAPVKRSVAKAAAKPAQKVDTAPPSVSKEVREYIAKKYGFGPGEDNMALLNAQKAASEDKFATNMGRAFNTISSALGGTKNDSSFYDTLDEQSQQSVQDLKDRQKSTQDNYKLAQQQKGSDPGSKKSVAMQSAIKRLYPNTFSDEELSSVSADDMDLIFKPLQLKEQIEARKEIAKAAREDRQYNRQTTRDEKLRVESKLSEKQVGDISTHDKAIQALDNVIAQKPKWDTGAVSFGLNKVAGLFGLDDSEKSAFKSDVGESLAQYIKGISGATVSPSERASLLANVPSVTDNDDTFMAKANHLKSRLLANREIELSNMRKSGKDVAEYSAPVNVNSKQKITVSNGEETLLIDPSDLADAEKDGYKAVK
jgi:hypothetical protein